MSYMLLPHETFRAIASTLLAYRHSTEDRLHRPTNIVAGSTSEKYIINMVKGLLILNIRSCELHGVTREQSDQQVMALADSVLDRVAIDKTAPLDIYQMLKSCECLHYNCYPETPVKDVERLMFFLIDIIEGIRCHLIGLMPEYQAAKWG